MPTQAERANLGMFMVNLFCVVLLAFVESWDEPAIILAAGIGLPIGVAPIVWYMWGALVTVARTKALEKQRTRSVRRDGADRFVFRTECPEGAVLRAMGRASAGAACRSAREPRPRPKAL